MHRKLESLLSFSQEDKVDKSSSNVQSCRGTSDGDGD